VPEQRVRRSGTGDILPFANHAATGTFTIDMPTIDITARAAEIVERVRAQRSGPLTFTIDGGCCEGTAPHLYEHYVLAPGAHAVAEVCAVPVYMPEAMATLYEDARVTIDVVDDPLSDAMSLETEYGVRFVLRESASGAAE